MSNRKPFSRQNTCLVAVALLALFTLAVPSTATADTIETFDVTGSFYPLTNVSFTSPALQNLPIGPDSIITIDTTTGLCAGSVLVLSSGEEFGFLPTFNQDGNYAWSDVPEHTLELSNPAGFKGFTGGPIEARYNIFSLPTISFNTVLTPVPEPASICMLGAGLLSLMGLILLRKGVA